MLGTVKSPAVATLAKSLSGMILDASQPDSENMIELQAITLQIEQFIGSVFAPSSDIWWNIQGISPSVAILR